MTRHFVPLFLLIVLTLAGSSWVDDRILAAYGRSEHPRVQIEILNRADIAGDDTLDKLARGETVPMQGSGNQAWTLKQIDPHRVLALKTSNADSGRGPVEWALTFAFYATIAMVLMAWIWPLTRDLRRLELAVARFGDRNWRFEASIQPHSQISPLAQTFHRMARRIDELIASHKDMSNAVAHEIKTPLSRMQFELELAQRARSREELDKSIDNIEADIGAINNLVTATLNYAILERAEVALNQGSHNFETLLPAMVESAGRGAPTDVRVSATVHGRAQTVICDIHLLETVIKNLVTNAMRYAKHDVQVAFGPQGSHHELTVDDDGPGVPEKERQRVFDSFVQLDQSPGTKTGFGLGLAIVRRIIEWHGGDVVALQSPLGGARFRVRWPILNA